MLTGLSMNTDQIAQNGDSICTYSVYSIPDGDMLRSLPASLKISDNAQITTRKPNAETDREE